LSAQFDLDAGAEGVVITKVSPGSDAARKDLRPGDLILEVNQEEVSTPAGAEKRIKQAKSDGYKTVLLLVSRRGDERFESVRFKAG
ncbi:MAG: PDZ domain-containing protein, partial [Kiloniellales bacterium]